MPPQREIPLCHYRYDPLDRLIGSMPLKQTEFQRFYCKSRLTTEIQGQVQCSIFQQGDQLLAQQQREGGEVETSLLATDQPRSVLQVLSTNERQQLVYSAYGHRRTESGLSSLMGFNGERPDPVTGHYLLGNGYRAFNPVLMRFNSPDSLSPFGKGGLNPYAYCLGDPVNFGDLTGHNPFRTLWRAVKSLGRKKEMVSKLSTGSVGEVVSQVSESMAPTPMGFFEKIQGMTNINEKIIQNLPAADMISLASTSKAMNRTVFESATPLRKVIDNIDKLDDIGREVGVWSLGRLTEEQNFQVLNVAYGQVDGVLPAQLARDGIRIDFAENQILAYKRMLRERAGGRLPRLSYPHKNWFDDNGEKIRRWRLPYNY